MTALELRGIRKRYGAVETLKGIDLTLDSGEFLVLLGPSGCGKSTLLNAIAGLIDPSEGDIVIGGRSVVKVHPKDRDIAMVFQSYALYPNMTVARNIGFGLEMRRVAAAQRDKAVADVARLLQIDHLLNRRPGQLSGGQRQRVAIGRALVRDPQVFLFDEPLSNLDAKLRMEMRTELKRLHQHLGTTIVYVTHDQIEAMTLATRIAVMRDGRIEQLGTPEQVYNSPASLYVAGFMGSPPMNMLAASIGSDGLTASIDGCDHWLPVPAALRAALPPGRRVVIGLRPERIGLAAADTPGALQVLTEVVELTGPEKTVVTRLGRQTLLASLPASAPVAVGQPLRLQVAPDAPLWFDPDSGAAIA